MYICVCMCACDDVCLCVCVFVFEWGDDLMYVCTKYVNVLIHLFCISVRMNVYTFCNQSYAKMSSHINVKLFRFACVCECVCVCLGVFVCVCISICVYVCAYDPSFLYFLYLKSLCKAPYLSDIYASF